MNLNRAMIIGNLTRDPELRNTPNGQNVANFGVATNHSWTDSSGQRQEKAEFHNIVAWGRLAEFCGQYVTKGRQLYIEGRIRRHEYEKNGQRMFFTEVHADTIELLGSRSDSGGGGGYPDSSYGGGGGSYGGGGEPSGGGPSFPEDGDEDVPF